MNYIKYYNNRYYNCLIKLNDERNFHSRNQHVVIINYNRNHANNDGFITNITKFSMINSSSSIIIMPIILVIITTIF